MCNVYVLAVLAVLKVIAQVLRTQATILCFRLAKGQERSERFFVIIIMYEYKLLFLFEIRVCCRCV